jgi:5-formyltetrahydrofolate cyclo-ligase
MMTTKGELRERALKARRALDSTELAGLSRMVSENLYALPEFQRAVVMASYVAKEDEVQTAPIIERAIKEGKRVIVPKTESVPKRLRFFEIRSLTELSAGNFGVLEPNAAEGSIQVPLAETDVTLVPLVAWDDGGNRIGYGKGLFDQELRSRGSSIAIGLALEAQRVERVPITERDVPLDIIVTERRILRFPRRGQGLPTNT